MFRKLLMFLVVLALVGLPIMASGANDFALPEKNGVYSVPGRPDLRLRVIVHPGKQDAIARARAAGKPLPPPPTEQCKLASEVDQNSDAIVTKAGWILPSGTWSYSVNMASIPSTIGTTGGEQLITNSFFTWQSELGSNVTFSRAGTTYASRAQRDNQNIVTWGRTSGSALAVTYVWYNTFGVATEIDTIFNKNFTWYWSDPDTWPNGKQCAYGGVYDAQDILTHEIGHTVGLDDEYTTGYVNNTMYGYGSTGETKKNSLTTGDKAGVAALYQP